MHVFKLFNGVEGVDVFVSPGCGGAWQRLELCLLFDAWYVLRLQRSIIIYFTAKSTVAPFNIILIEQRLFGLATSMRVLFIDLLLLELIALRIVVITYGDHIL